MTTSTNLGPEFAAEPREWRERRQQELDRIEAQLIDDYVDLNTTPAEAIARYKPRRRAVLDPMWLPPRPPRRMKAAQLVAHYWEDREPFNADVAHPACFKCSVAVDEWRDLERAHLVDRFLGGLDHEPNLAMLCRMCHAIMPMFAPHEGASAISWVRSAFAGFDEIAADLTPETRIST